jgi:hypothetical protein
MISHLVLFEPHRSMSADQRRSILDSVAHAVRRCPTVRGCRIGRRVRQGLPGYEQAMREDYQYALLVDFDDLEGLRAYLVDPAHAPIGELFTSAAAASLAYDYEVFGLEEASARSLV